MVELESLSEDNAKRDAMKRQLEAKIQEKSKMLAKLQEQVQEERALYMRDLIEVQQLVHQQQGQHIIAASTTHIPQCPLSKLLPTPETSELSMFEHEKRQARKQEMDQRKHAIRRRVSVYGKRLQEVERLCSMEMSKVREAHGTVDGLAAEWDVPAFVEGHDIDCPMHDFLTPPSLQRLFANPNLDRGQVARDPLDMFLERDSRTSLPSSDQLHFSNSLEFRFHTNELQTNAKQIAPLDEPRANLRGMRGDDGIVTKKAQILRPGFRERRELRSVLYWDPLAAGHRTPSEEGRDIEDHVRSHYAQSQTRDDGTQSPPWKQPYSGEPLESDLRCPRLVPVAIKELLVPALDTPSRRHFISVCDMKRPLGGNASTMPDGIQYFQ